MNKREIGSSYETLAAKILIREGCEILDRNFHTRHAEIDIIARDGPYLVFVEVKYRRDDTYGGPFPAVTQKKQYRISKAASVYMFSKGYPADTPVRFDVIGFRGNTYKHIKNAFSYRR